MIITKDALIGIVGPCGAGKSTLQMGLRKHGYKARAIAQEHSYVPDMWQRLTKPDILIFLQVSHAIATRRKNMSWTLREWQEQQRRLTHARSYANFFLDTCTLDISDVLQATIGFLKS